MQQIFFSGSRSLKALPPPVQQRIRQNILQKNFEILIGDANGADKSLQEFLAQQRYHNVQVFCAGNECRNNVGNWQIHTIATEAKGRQFYTAKDLAMADTADYGFVLWDGKSIGSLNNIAELLNRQKPTLVYFEPTNDFVKILSSHDLLGLLKRVNASIFTTIEQKGSSYLNQLIQPQQQPALL